MLKSGVDIDPETLRQELVARVRDQIGAVATFRDVTVVAALPKTRSGKILRKTMRQIATTRSTRSRRPSRTRAYWTSCPNSFADKDSANSPVCLPPDVAV